MKRILSALLLILLVAAILPAQLPAHASGTPQISVTSRYILDRYGFATVNETVMFKNNGSATVQTPDVGIGFGNLSQYIASVNVTGQGTLVNSLVGGSYVVTGGGSLPAGGNSNFTLTALLDGVASLAKNGSVQVLLLTSPYLSLRVDKLLSVVQMPVSTQFVSTPRGFAQFYSATNITYYKTQQNVTTQSATTGMFPVKPYSLQDFHPIQVYSASRTITMGTDGTPDVEDILSFKNLGTTPLQTLIVAPLASSNAAVTIEPSGEPPLSNPLTLTLSNYGINLANSAIGSVPAGNNDTIVYQYSLGQQYYTVSGDTVNLKIPLAPPIRAFIGSYTIETSFPAGVRVLRTTAPERTVTNASPLESGSVSFGYALSIGWALNSGIPVASILFIFLLVGLFVSKSTMTEEEETEEETSTERASAMIKAFEDKTGLINQLFTEIPNADSNQRDKAYFDELRGRLDAYRSRALQRLNEVKQKSTTQKFFDLLNQLHTTEREVDRAAKDTLNLYEQYYTNRMRKEVFDRLLPQYRRRLEKALDQLSEELHVVQREAKLL